MAILSATSSSLNRINRMDDNDFCEIADSPAPIAQPSRHTPVTVQYRNTRVISRTERVPFTVVTLVLSGLVGLCCVSGAGLRLPGPDGGQADSSGDIGHRSETKIDSVADTKVICQPDCEIYCMDGNLLDANGCPTCTCKRAAQCLITACIPRDCPYGELLDVAGCLVCVCAPVPCREYTTPTDCALNGRCRWLEPGCGSPALAAAGCHDLAEMNCALGHSCPTGRRCQKRVINPCSGIADCNACGQMVSFCL